MNSPSPRRSMIVVSRPDIGHFSQLLESMDQDIHENPYFSHANIPLLPHPPKGVRKNIVKFNTLWTFPSRLFAYKTGQVRA